MAKTQVTTPVTTPVAAVVLVEGRKLVQLTGCGAMHAAKHVVAKTQHGTLGNLPATKAGLTLEAGVPCKVRVPINAARWERVAAELGKHGGKAPAAKLAEAATGDFVAYAITRKWLRTVA